MFPLCTSVSLSLSVWTVASCWTHQCHSCQPEPSEKWLSSPALDGYTTREKAPERSCCISPSEVWGDVFVFSQERCSGKLEVIISVLQSWKKNLHWFMTKAVIFREASIPFIFRPSMSTSTCFCYLSILIVVLKGATYLALIILFRFVLVGCCCGLPRMNSLCWDVCLMLFRLWHLNSKFNKD